MKELELYIHIPFCVKKCAYCDFLSAPASLEVQLQYLEALKAEIRANRGLGQEYEVSSVFFGGGTPSIIPGEGLASVLDEIRGVFRVQLGAEITIECNPGTLTKEKLDCYKKAGVNRLSIGLQSAQDAELKTLGRIHTWADFTESFSLAREAGFSNINVDLMSALPGQTLDTWQDTLDQVAALNPEHISAYSLILEDGTPFYERYGMETMNSACADKAMDDVLEEKFLRLPDEDTERQMYYDTRVRLEQAGYLQYEISNYAKPGYECRHNLGYWNRTEYKGFGIGAASLLGNCRLQNTSDLDAYLKWYLKAEQPVKFDTKLFPVVEIEKLTSKDILSETMFLGLRTMQGVRLTTQMKQIYKETLKKYGAQGFLKEEAGYLRLTEQGIDVSNWILADFLLESDEI